MKNRGIFSFLWVLLLIALFVSSVQAEPQRSSSGAAPFSKEQLSQMLAPIALYPDALLSQILMASTYPLEIVEADRWVRKNGGLKGDALDEALKNKEWDPSVKSLCHFPTIIASMSEKILQTTKLGNAFLDQQNDVMNVVQELRTKAKAEGNLSSSKEQKVIVEKEKIIIESADPETIYVPSYNPMYVYGSWWYPAYPPYYWGPGPVVAGAVISFWPGIYVGPFIGTWCYFDWYDHVIFIDWHRVRGFHHHHGNRHDRDRWMHDSGHRRGVAYRDRTTAERFGQPYRKPAIDKRQQQKTPAGRTPDGGAGKDIQKKSDVRKGSTVQPAKQGPRSGDSPKQQAPDRKHSGHGLEAR